MLYHSLLYDRTVTFELHIHCFHDSRGHCVELFIIKLLELRLEKYDRLLELHELVLQHNNLVEQLSDIVVQLVNKV